MKIAGRAGKGLAWPRKMEENETVLAARSSRNDKPDPATKGHAMKAFQLQEFGGPDALKPAELADPVPGPGQVLIRVRSRVAQLSRPAHVPGHLQSETETADRSRSPMVPAKSSRPAPGVTRFKPGERVVASFMPDWVDGPPDDDKGTLGAGRRGRRPAGRAGRAARARAASHPVSPQPRRSRHLALRGGDRLECPGRRAATSSPATRSSSRAPAASRSSRFSSRGWPVRA